MPSRRRAFLVPGLILGLGVLAWLLAGRGLSPPAEEQFAAARTLLEERFAAWRGRVQGAAGALTELAAEDATGPVARFRRADEIRAAFEVDGVALVRWDGGAEFWAGRTFDADPEFDFAGVESGIEVVHVLEHPAHRVLFAARPAGDAVAVAYYAFDERFPGRRDLAADLARATGLASVRLRFGSGTVPVRPPGADERAVDRAVVDGLVHATLFAPSDREREQRAGITGRRRTRVGLLVLGLLAAWALWAGLGRRLPADSGLRTLLAVTLVAAVPCLVSTLRLPVHPLFTAPGAVHPLWAAPGMAVLAAAALLWIAVLVDGAAARRRARGITWALGGLAVTGSFFLARGYVHLARLLAHRDDGVVLFDPIHVWPRPGAALVFAALGLLTAALFFLARAAARRAHAVRPALAWLPLAAMAPAVLPWEGLAVAAGCALALLSLKRTSTYAEKAFALTFLAAVVSFPLLYTAHRDAFVQDAAARARDLVWRTGDRDADHALAAAVAAATHPTEGVDKEVAAALARGADPQRLAFSLWAASRWHEGTPCAVQVWDASGALVSAFDFDSPPAAWLPPPPRNAAAGTHVLLGRGEGEAIRFYARDIALTTIGDEQFVGLARFVIPDRWDLLLSTLRPSMFSEPLDLIVPGASPPLVLADLAPDGAARRVSEGAPSDFPRPDPRLLERAKADGHAGASIDYQGRAARLVVAPARFSYAALVFADDVLQQGGFAFSKLLLLYSALCLLAVVALFLRRGVRVQFLFRHRVSLFLVVLSVPPVLLLAEYNRRSSRQRHQAEISRRLHARLDLAAVDLRRWARPPDNAWCARFAADFRLDVNVYRGQELVATSRPGVWDTGLLGRRLAAEPFVELVLEGRREHTGPVVFGEVSGIRSAYRRVREHDGEGAQSYILSAPALDDRVAVERQVAERNALLFAVYLLTATLTAFLGLFLARTLTRPVRRLQEATRRVAEGALDERLPEGGADEFGELQRAFNSMTAALQETQDLRARAERAAAWREMARQIAHDIKNPLTPIKLTIQNLMALQDSDPEAFQSEFEEGSRLILRQIDALYRIAGNFSAYARLPQRNPRPVRVESLLAEVAALYAAPDGCAVEATTEPASLVVEADRDELRRALINLVTNARQAQARRVRLVARAEDGWARLEVADDGIGIAPEMLDRIFEPSFTTKTSGTGLGMPIVKRIVDDHGGRIEIKSDARGTTVIVRLPRRE